MNFNYTIKKIQVYTLKGLLFQNCPYIVCIQGWKDKLFSILSINVVLQ